LGPIHETVAVGVFQLGQTNLDTIGLAGLAETHVGEIAIDAEAERVSADAVRYPHDVTAGVADLHEIAGKLGRRVGLPGGDLDRQSSSRVLGFARRTGAP